MKETKNREKSGEDYFQAMLWAELSQDVFKCYIKDSQGEQLKQRQQQLLSP